MTARILDQRNADRLPEPAYDRDGVTIYRGDCRTILPLLAAVDHVITDPPYEAEAHTLQRRIVNPRTQELRMAPLTFEAITADVRSDYSRLVSPLVERWCLTFCQVEAAMIWRDQYERGGLRYVRSMAWVKPNGQPQLTGDRPSMGYETIIAMHHTDERLRWNGGGRMGWFSCPVDANFSREPRVHETQKPLRLMRELVELFTDPGDLVLDPFAGSLTTAVACKQLGRRCIAIEMDAGYVQAGIKRLEATTLPLFVLAPEVVTQEGLGL